MPSRLASLVLFSIIFCSDPIVEPIAAQATMLEYIDQAYGSDPRQRYDLYQVKNKNAHKPLVLLIHGGGWVAGDKDEFRDLAQGLAAYGYAVATINYRYANGSDIGYLQLVQDIAACLQNLKTQSTTWGIDTQRCLLMGASAGAHLALLYGHRYDSARHVQGVISLAGPTDLTVYRTFSTDIQYLVNNVAPSTTDKANASPVFSTRSLPTLLLYGKADPIVPFSQALAMQKALEARSTNCQLLLFDNAGHEVFGTQGEYWEQGQAAIIDFIQRYLPISAN